MRVVRLGIAVGTVAGLLVAPAGASADLTFTQSGPTEARSGETVTFTMAVGNTGPGTEQVSVGMLALRASGHKPVNNPYQSVTSDSGTCTGDQVDSYGYHSADCQLTVPANQTAQIIARVQLNESMENYAGLTDSFGAIWDPDSQVVWAIYPPQVVESSKKIKLRGLPDGCVDEDFKLRAKAKGAKKVVASLAGPYDEWHDRLDGDGFGGKIGSEKGKKLKLQVPIGDERAGFYDLKVTAKYEKKPKQKTEVSIQRCGVPV